MQYRRLGKSELEVSTVAMGCWAIVGGKLWGKQDEQDSIRSLQAALDAGITLFDTAEGYGNGYSEELLAKALRKQRDELVIASKVSPQHLAPEELITACENSLRRLKTDYIDLYQIHWPNEDVPLAESMWALQTLQQQGKIRYAGVSNFGVRDTSAALAEGRIESNQLCYNLLTRAVEHEIQPLCLEHEVSLLCYSPLLQGLLTGKFASPDEVPEGRARSRHFSQERPLARHDEPGCEAETFACIDALREIAGRLGESMGNVAMAWLLARPAVASVIAGARQPEQVQRNAAAAEVRLPAEAIAELDAASEAVKEALGTNADIWQSDSRIH